MLVPLFLPAARSAHSSSASTSLVPAALVSLCVHVDTPPSLGPDLRCARRCTVHHPTYTVVQGPSTRAGQPLLEHHEEAVVQFLDAGGLALPVRFQECAASRLERQKTRKDDERVLEYHRHALAATHLVPSCVGDLLPLFRRRTSSSSSCGQQTRDFGRRRA